MRTIGSIILMFLLFGCSSVPITKIEYVQKTAPQELYDIPEYPVLQGDTQGDVGLFIIELEQRCRYIQNNLISLKAFYASPE